MDRNAGPACPLPTQRAIAILTPDTTTRSAFVPLRVTWLRTAAAAVIFNSIIYRVGGEMVKAWAVIFVVVLFVFLMSGWAQVTTATVYGTVVDTSGARIPGG